MFVPPQFDPTQFRGKTWIFFAQAIIFGQFAVFALVLGPLFLTGAMKRADGRPATDAGIPLTVMGTIFAAVTALAVFNIVARRRPLVRLCREGIVVNRIGVSSLDGVPAIPGFGRAMALLRVAWLVVSLQGFRQQLVYSPWESFRAAQVSGLTMQRRLTIFASFFRPPNEEEWPEHLGKWITFEEVAFAVPLDHVAHSVTMYFTDVSARQRLPSWHD